MDECFDLFPPGWLKDEWLKNPKSTELFRTYMKNAPKGLVRPGSSTHQGVYCMTADGHYLAGHFSFASKERTIQLLKQGQRKFAELAKEKGWRPKAIPKDKPEVFLGKPAAKGGLKLRLAVRDLPRGDKKFSGHGWVGDRPFNMGWLDLDPAEAKQFITESKREKALSRALVKKISINALKDTARGQFNVQKESFQDGALAVSCVAKTASKLTIHVAGQVTVQGGGIRYEPKLFGIIEYDRNQEKFTRFDVLASGQRKGAGQFNARQGDAREAPLGVAFKLYQSG